jgi:hypothetical protein
MDNLHIEIIKSFEGIEEIRQIWEKMQAKEAYPTTNADIDRYLLSIKAPKKQVQPYIILIKNNDTVISMLIGSIHESRIKCDLGRKTIFKPLLKTLTIVYGGILGNQSETICNLLVGEITTLLSSGEIDAAHFNHLVTDSFFYKYTRKKINIFCRSHFPKTLPIRYLLIPQSFDQFLDACSHNSRRNYRRWTKKFENNFKNRFEIKTYSNDDEVDTALEQMAGISAKTYQGACGRGIVNDTATQVLFHNAAKKNWLRSYIISIDNKPCAFWTGLKYGSVFYAEFTGYLTKWRKFHIGTILFFKLVRDLCENPDVGFLDFSLGEGQHKHWGESRLRSVASVYIFAPRVFPIIVNIIHSSLLSFRAFAIGLAKRLYILNVIQKHRHRRIIQKKIKAHEKNKKQTENNQSRTQSTVIANTFEKTDCRI